MNLRLHQPDSMWTKLKKWYKLINPRCKRRNIVKCSLFLGANVKRSPQPVVKCSFFVQIHFQKNRERESKSWGGWGWRRRRCSWNIVKCSLLKLDGAREIAPEDEVRITTLYTWIFISQQIQHFPQKNNHHPCCKFKIYQTTHHHGPHNHHPPPPHHGDHGDHVQATFAPSWSWLGERAKASAGGY